MTPPNVCVCVLIFLCLLSLSLLFYIPQDVFAFVIDMPTLHRLSCFRDDIIFFVYM